MNFTKNMKSQLALVALGASFFFATTLRAQEIDNAHFDAPATSMSGNFNTPAPVNTAAVNPQAVNAEVAPATVQTEASLGNVTTSRGTILAIAILLNLIELALRKWRGIIESLRGVRSRHDSTVAA